MAFDTGLLTVDVSLQVHVSSALANAVRADPLIRQYYGRPPLRDTILLPDQAQLPSPSTSTGTGPTSSLLIRQLDTLVTLLSSSAAIGEG